MTKEKTLDTLKNSILFISICILFLLPILKYFIPIALFLELYSFNILRLIGIIGLNFLIFTITIIFYNNKDKNQYFKQILPIFLLLLYLIWTFFSALLAKDRYLAFYGTNVTHEGFLTYIAYAGCFGLAFCLKSNKLRKILLYIFLIVAILTIILIQFTNNGYFLKYILNKSSSTSSFGNCNHYGYYLLIATIISCFLFISEKNKILKILDSLIYIYLLYYLIMNNTFGCYLALILTLIFALFIMIIKKEKKLPIIFSILIFIIISSCSNININNKNTNVATNNIKILSQDVKNIVTASSVNEYSVQHAGSGRMQIWISGIKFFIQKPIIGYGPENLKSEYAKINIKQNRPHNLFIQLATTSGLPGLLLYTSAIRHNIITRLKNFKF